jgi:tetratricopeptide (TPR) repeat protein
MPTLLVCHVPEDDTIATRIFQALSAADIECWVDHVHGEGSDDEVEAQVHRLLPDALGGIFVLSPDSISDTTCLSQLQALSNLNRRIFVLIWKNIPADQMPEWLNAYPWIDLTQNVDHGLLEFLYLLKGRPTYEPSPTATQLKPSNLSGDFPAWHLDLPLIGRDADMSALRKALAEGHRGTLIQGFSGVGKTRLAAELAITLKYRHGIVWYTFTPSSTLDDLADAIIRHLNLDMRTESHDLWPLLRKYEMLLVLDGAEDCPQPKAFAEQFNRLALQRGAQLLITSRHLWMDLNDVRVYELRPPSPSVCVEILRRMAHAQSSGQVLKGAEQSLVRAAHCRPRLLWYAVRWAAFFPLNYVLELVTTLKSANAKDAYEELVNKTLVIASRHDQWPEVEAALKKLTIFRKGFTFDAARALLGDPHSLQLLKMWGMIAFDGERYEADPLLRLALESDRGASEQHFAYYKALAVEAGARQDYARLVAELDNIDTAFTYALERNDVRSAFDIAQACLPMMGAWAKFDMRKQWLERLADCLADNTRDPLYADVQIALGIAYQERPGADRRSSLQKSVTCFERAAHRYLPARAPQHYAMIRNNLGITYRTLAETDHPAENLPLAIQAFKDAAQHFSLRESPVQFAAVQNNLGAAYLTLAGVKDRVDNLWLAVAAFRRAGTQLRPDQHPIMLAKVYHNLGTAYGELAEVSAKDRKVNLERAISNFTRALTLATPQVSPLDYARTSYNLALAYRAFAEHDQPEACMQNAITGFNNALRYWTLKTAPANFASAKMALGQAWLEYAEVEAQPNYLEKAVESFQAALTFYTYRLHPSEFVKTMILLGIGLRRLGKKRDAELCWQRAERYFRQIGMTEMADQLVRWLNPELTPA